MREVLLDGDWLNSLIIAGDMANPTYPALKSTDSLDMAMKLFGQQHVEELPVIEDSRLVGSVKRSDVLEEYHRELMKRDLAGSFQGALAWTARAKNIDLGEGYMMAEMECPPDFVGKSPRELNARVHYGVEVILIRPAKKPGTEAVVVVSPDYRFINGDVLLVIGKKESVRSLMD
jgi:hypothetical protein